MSKSWPSIDHSILSPSGRCSKRARKAALDREASRLFPPGFCTKGDPVEAPRSAVLRRQAATLRELAARGMCPRKYAAEAQRLEAEAAALDDE